MKKLMDEIKFDAGFVKSHTLQPAWYKVLKVFILVGFLAGYTVLFGWRKMGVFLVAFLFLVLVIHMVYRVKTRRFSQSWMDFVVVEEGAERRYQRIGKVYYAAVILSTIIAITISQLAVPAPRDVPLAFEMELPAGMSSEDGAALSSLERVDDYPLYTMTITGEPGRSSSISPAQTAGDALSVAPGWGCALFASFADPQNMLYGRNFDWEYSPALLLFRYPAQGYASVSMVDLAYFGFSPQQLTALDETPLEERLPLLQTLSWPFDGMNDQGLVVGMAAVSPGNVADDPGKQSIGSLGVIREMLDHAASVDEAVEILRSYNIDFSGGPPLHYLIADASQHAVLVEHYAGEVVFIENETNWHAATNFLVAEAGGNPEGWCPRYDRLASRLSNGEALTRQNAMELLKSVAQNATQWSVVYDYSRAVVQVALGKNYDRVYTFTLDQVDDH